MTVFKRFDADDIVRANPSEVTVGLWTGDTGSLTSFPTSSTQGAAESGQFYWNVYNADPSASTSEIQFALAYGHRTGGGHPTLTDDDGSTLATKVVYSQYRNLVLDPGDEKFTFYGGYDSDHIYVINIQRARIRERLDPGNWSLTLSGSNGFHTFIDDSEQSLGASFGKLGQVFNVVSGSLTGPSGSTIVSQTGSRGGYGLFYPSLGLIVLNPDAITTTVGFQSGSFGSALSRPFAPVTTSQATPQYNHAGLLYSIRGGADFQARSAENISSTHYFVRLKAKDFNYSNNPSFFDEGNGTLTHQSYINDPKTYPTTIGLYNDANELLAVAKLTQPVQKSFSSEVAVKVRLDW